MRHILIILGTALFLTSCEKTISYDIPRAPDQFSVDARILTGETLQVFAAHTEYSLSSLRPEVVSDAEVKVFENDVEMGTLQWIQNSSSSGFYRSNFRPSTGNSYRIEVSHPKYGMAWGEAASLAPVTITNYVLDTNELSIQISFQDPSGTADFYEIRTYVRVDNRDSPLFMATADPLVDFFYEFDEGLFGDNLTRGYAAYLTDEAFNGRIRTVKFEDVFFAGGFGGVPEGIVLEVTRISRDYYRHENSKGAQFTSGDNPFAEPAQIFSNVNNGFGIVAAGAPTRILVTL